MVNFQSGTPKRNSMLSPKKPQFPKPKAAAPRAKVRPITKLVPNPKIVSTTKPAAKTKTSTKTEIAKGKLP